MREQSKWAFPVFASKMGVRPKVSTCLRMHAEQAGGAGTRRHYKMVELHIGE